MTDRLTATLFNPQQAKAEIDRAWRWAKEMTFAGHRLVLTLKPETRTEAQNRLMWPLLEQFSKQLLWPVDGRMVQMAAEEWKDVLSAGFQKETVRLAMGINGGVVMLGRRTSKFTKKQFADWIDFLYATAADRDVRLPAWVDEDTGEILRQAA